MKKTIIFQIDGGLGKSIMGTAVLRAIRKQYINDYIIVVTGYPDVFIGNPNANKILNHTQTSGIYKKHIMINNRKFFNDNSYSYTCCQPDNMYYCFDHIIDTKKKPQTKIIKVPILSSDHLPILSRLTAKN